MQRDLEIHGMFKRRYLLGAFTAAFILSSASLPINADTIFACSQPSKAPKDLGTLSLASIPANMPTAQWGIDQGCFKKYGLEIKTTSVASAQIGMAGLVGESFDLFMNTPSNIVSAMANGDFAAKIIAPRHGYSAEELARAKREPLYPGQLLMQTVLLVKKSSAIQSWKDLEKSKIGVKSFRGSDHAGVILAMRASAANSYKTEFLAMTDAQMVAALDRGDVDAVVPSDPYATSIILSGARVIGYPSAYYFEPGAAVVYVSTATIVAKKPAAMRAFQRAILEINHLLNLPQNDATYRKTIAKVTGVSDDAVAKLKLPKLSESNVALSEISYISNKLKLLGFTKSRVSVGHILFR